MVLGSGFYLYVKFDRSSVKPVAIQQSFLILLEFNIPIGAGQNRSKYSVYYYQGVAISLSARLNHSNSSLENTNFERIFYTYT